MEHSGEVWQELDYNGTRLGGIVSNDLDLSKIKLFVGVAMMLYRYRNGEVEFLFQHRSKFLRGNPDKWDVSAGGHINLDEEEVVAMQREAWEEIGAEIDVNELEIAAFYRRQHDAMVCLYFYDWSERKDEFRFNDQEVEEVKWVKYTELDEFLPNLKTAVREDEVFMHYMATWNARILEKYGDL